MYGDGHMMNGDWGSGWMLFGGIWMVPIWALVILGIVALVRWIWGRPDRSDDVLPATALEVLKMRYARGEIDREEFEQKRRDLSQ